MNTTAQIRSEEDLNKFVQTLHVADDLSGPLCRICGAIMRQSGTCSTCTECGETSGCG